MGPVPWSAKHISNKKVVWEEKNSPEEENFMGPPEVGEFTLPVDPSRIALRSGYWLQKLPVLARLTESSNRKLALGIYGEAVYSL